MTPARAAAIVIVGLLAAPPALAQAPSPGPTGGDRPEAGPAGSAGGTSADRVPERAGSISAVGRTKPPGATLGDQLGTRPDLEARSRELNRRIETGICTGCR